MTQKDQYKIIGDTLWDIANDLRGAMNPDDFRDIPAQCGLAHDLGNDFCELTAYNLSTFIPISLYPLVKCLSIPGLSGTMPLAVTS